MGEEWKGKISNTAQVGGIETSVVDNGPGRGVRIAWVNTGSPLRYKVVIDRALDIVDAFYSRHSLAWLSHGGITAPDPAACYDAEWLRTFGGGLLTTCGLSHIGAPETDDSGTRGLHGRISNQPAELISIEQPDLANGSKRIAITAVIRESTVFGPHLELYRTISGELGSAEIAISDRVVNRGNRSAPHMLLYHCNFGYPLVDEGARLHWKGKTVSRGTPMDDRLFAGEHDYSQCCAPIPEHRGGGESCGFITPEPEEDGLCHAGVVNEKLHLAVWMRFDSRQLPCMTNWQHWGPGEYVTALEPGTNHPVGQAAARTNNELIMLEPGEERNYELTFSVTEG